VTLPLGRPLGRPLGSPLGCLLDPRYPWLLPVISLTVLVAAVAVALAAAGYTLGFDFYAYSEAARRLTQGQRLYDPSISVAGPFGIFLYPPPFALAVTPLLLLPEAVARIAWDLAMAACLPIGAALLPVRREVRWLIVLLGALNWPFLFSVNLGQVGPLLFVLFAAAWRWLDRAWPLAIVIAAGTLIKLQPAILIPWAAVTGRWRVVWSSVAILVAVCAASTALTGVAVWADYVAVLRRVSWAVTTPHNCSPGAVLYQAGVLADVAGAVQWLSTAVAAGAVLLAWRYARPVGAFQVTALASQLLTPLLWDHYAMLLLLPAAWLLDRGRTWAVAIPLLGWAAFYAYDRDWVQASTIPLSFFACLAVLLWEARLERRETADEGTRDDLLAEGAPSSPSLGGTA
jgi:hypothetical protein